MPLMIVAEMCDRASVLRQKIRNKQKSLYNINTYNCRPLRTEGNILEIVEECANVE